MLKPNKAVAEFLARARDHLGAKQGELADIIGVRSASVSRWEADGRVDPKFISPIAVAYKVSEAELIALLSSDQRHVPQDLLPLILCIAEVVKGSLCDGEWHVLRDVYLRLGAVSPELVRETLTLLRKKEG